MNPTVVTYVIYLVVSVVLTFWVARTLSRLGDVFLVDVFHGDEKIAAATNRLLVVGFYLVNLGFVAFMLRVTGPVLSAQDAIEALASKLGGVAFVLGVFHLANVAALSSVRRRRHAPPHPHVAHAAAPRYAPPPPAYGASSAPHA